MMSCLQVGYEPALKFSHPCLRFSGNRCIADLFFSTKIQSVFSHLKCPSYK